MSNCSIDSGAPGRLTVRGDLDFDNAPDIYNSRTVYANELRGVKRGFQLRNGFGE